MTATITERATLLRLEGIRKHFPGVIALRDVDFEARAGEVHALLGENGAGKSTLMGVAGGEIVPDAGAITLGGETTERLKPEVARRHGLAIVHQHPALLHDLTVAENMEIAVPVDYAKGLDADWMRQALHRVGCHVKLNARLEELGVANCALMELARAIVLDRSHPSLDAPTAALGAD